MITENADDETLDNACDLAWQDIKGYYSKEGSNKGNALAIDGSDIRRTLEAMKGRAGGADAWTVDDLTKMPDEWFEDWAALYETCRASGRIPGR